MDLNELSIKIDEWRQKQIQGTLTDEELREALVALRAGRVGASRISRKAPVQSAESMLDELDAL